MKAIIPTGGRGTRMQPLTFSSNKHFIPVANKNLIYYPIEAVVSAGIKEIALTYNPGYLDEVKNVLGDGSRWGAKFTYVLQEKPIGLANIFQVCEKYLDGDPFLLHLGDNIFTEGIKPYVEHFLKEKPNGLVTMVRHPENWRLGVPYFDENNRLIKYIEKPKNPPHDFAIPGLYFFDNNVFKCFKGKDAIKPSERGEYEISSPYQWLLDHDYRVDVLEYKGKWLDPGKFDDWVESNKYLLENVNNLKVETTLDKSVSIKGSIGVGKNCFIKNTTVEGPVSIGDNVKIEDCAIGPYTSIYHNCRISNSELENTILLEGVTISDASRLLKDSMIGKNSVIKSSGRSSFSLFIGDKSEVDL